MYNTKVIEKVTKLELEKGISVDASWHQDVTSIISLLISSIKTVLTYLSEDLISI
jgi:hypothetical protein